MSTKLALSPAALAATLAGLGGGYNAVRKFRQADPTSTVGQRAWEGAKGFGTGAAVGGLTGYGIGKGLQHLAPDVVEAMKRGPFHDVQPGDALETPKRLAQGAYQLWQNPIIRAGSGVSMGMGAAHAMQDFMDEHKMRQVAAIKAKEESPDVPDAAQLGYLQMKHRMGDYRSSLPNHDKTSSERMHPITRQCLGY